MRSELNRLEAPPGWRVIEFISDLHLQAAQPHTFAAWERYLHTTGADAVFILGDLFEVWVGDDSALVAGSFEAQCVEILKAASARLQIFFMRGNRDFLVGDDLLARCGITGLSDPCLLQFASQRWLLSHGDALCTSDTRYQEFRKLVRSVHWQSEFLARPLMARQQIALEMRSQSEQLKQSGQIYADVSAEAASQLLGDTQAHRLIHGHTHRPGEHFLGGATSRSVLSDWDLSATPPRAEVFRLTSSDGNQHASAQRIALAGT